MEVGVNLPNDSPAATGELLLEWARRADAGPFSSIGVTDRVVWPTFEPFTTLAAAAAVTHRIRIMTAIAVAPLRNGAMLAKAAATLDALSGGRLLLGLAVGPRADDYEVSGVDFSSRGKRFDQILTELRSHWEEGSSIGPRPAQAGGPRIVIGGLSDRAFARMARHADGYIHGGGPPRAFARAANNARTAWTDVGRPGQPRLLGHGYFALGGDEAADLGARHLREYYGFLGPFAERIAEGLLTTPHAIAQYVRGYEDAGCDELLLFPTQPGLDELDRLADVLGSLHQRQSRGAEASA